VQRLRRIRQLGVGYLVFPGAEHTRFGHALGAMALMHDLLAHLSESGTTISPEEHQAALAAALLHDIGHGPFSHTLEHELIADFHHERMSRVLLMLLNERFGGVLDLAVQIFDNTYPRPFFHQLVSSQLDVDRLDYLRRDSFYTGVVEGRVGVERIIKTMRIHPPEGGAGSRLVVEEKGAYAVENFLLARRLMYWQVYLHRSVLAGDHLLRALIRRVRYHLEHGRQDLARDGAPTFLFFLENRITAADLVHPDVRSAYCTLDDTDVLYSLKRWLHSADPILADLCRRFLHRDFFRVSFYPAPPSEAQVGRWRAQVEDWVVEAGLSPAGQAQEAASYYLSFDASRHSAYASEESAILILERDGRVRELSESTDTANVAALTTFVVKPYVCHPKEVWLAGLADS
jgi:HD superfamily phosphohydrolase